MPAQLAPIALHALNSEVQHRLSELQVHLAVYDHWGWKEDKDQRWFEQRGLGHFFPRHRHRLWTWLGVFYSLFLPLITVTCVYFALTAESQLAQRSLWAMSLGLSLGCGWLSRKTWRSWRYHKEQDLQPTTGLYVLPGVLLLRLPSTPAPGGRMRREWCMVPIESVRDIRCECEAIGAWQNRRQVWTCELELAQPADNGARFLKLWEHPDFVDNGPIQTALRSWSEQDGQV